jgi:hypothetical protein
MGFKANRIAFIFPEAEVFPDNFLYCTMPRRPARFLQSDVRRAVQGAMDAGLVVTRVEVDLQGKIVIVSGSEAKFPAAADARTGVIAQRLRERDGS